MSLDSFRTRRTLQLPNGRAVTYWSLPALAANGFANLDRLPYSTRVLLENLLRHEDETSVSRADIEAVASWNPAQHPELEIAFRVARVILQDFTGVPAVVDLAAMRDAMVKMGGDPSKINPLQPVDLVIDHSVMVDHYGTPEAFAQNAALEFDRNRERYQLLRWGQSAFRDFRVVPPDTGIVHQVNLEFLASTVFTRTDPTTGETLAYPDTCVGTDSHTPMVNGLGVVGWGVGGIEAEAAMLGQPITMLLPEVVGVRVSGRLTEGVTATDLVLTATQLLRKRGVVGKFVEYFGPGLGSLSLPDRATLANMVPEYGATIGFFPVDARTLEFLRFSGRPDALVELVEAYTKAQGLFRTDASPDPAYSDVLELDLATIVPSLAGPKRPQDRVPLTDMAASFRRELPGLLKPGAAIDAHASVTLSGDVPAGAGTQVDLHHGSVVIAAITSCTNTSNPSVLMAAGLLARNAVARGLRVKPWVKTSLAPGSKVVTQYLRAAGLLDALEALNFHVVGYGCTTCIGNSGPLPEAVAAAIEQGKLVAASVLSGNRNFEGRVHPLVRANYLASPPLVVAYALAGDANHDMQTQPLGHDTAGAPVYLKELWPTQAQIDNAIERSLSAEMFRSEYGDAFLGDRAWQELPVPVGATFAWMPDSTYVKHPPFFDNLASEPTTPGDLVGARVLAVLGDSVTTDHISPAGNIAKDSPAGAYLLANGVAAADFNSYGARRGNHEVMMRGTFANVRLRNALVPGREGWWTAHQPSGEVMAIFDASLRYQKDAVPLVILAGQEYGSGSSRDWAAKGPMLLGVKAVVAQSYERIHRSNLVGMGILPLQFGPGVSAQSLGLDGTEVFDVTGIAAGVRPGMTLTVRATAQQTAGGATSGKVTLFDVTCRIDTPVEVEYHRHGGILQYVLRGLARDV
ncbi:MAG: aconitate hydratase AcnA [Myxococcales bacterium]|nr:aconitate hydratase AcnA [Myxococcales bacterium]